jgi:hypothetical protein
VPPVTHTHALFADQSHSIPDNLVALLGDSRAWNCSDPEPLIRSTFAKINALLAMSVTCGNSENISLTRSFTAPDPNPTFRGDRVQLLARCSLRPEGPIIQTIAA